MKHNLGDLKDLKRIRNISEGPKIPALNMTAGLKPISETYGDDSDNGSLEEDTSGGLKLNLGMPEVMSKTFDTSLKVVPKLDFRKLKHVKEQKDWYGY